MFIGACRNPAHSSVTSWTSPSSKNTVLKCWTCNLAPSNTMLLLLRDCIKFADVSQTDLLCWTPRKHEKCCYSKPLCVVYKETKANLPALAHGWTVLLNTCDLLFHCSVQVWSPNSCVNLKKRKPMSHAGGLFGHYSNDITVVCDLVSCCLCLKNCRCSPISLLILTLCSRTAHTNAARQDR